MQVRFVFFFFVRGGDFFLTGDCSVIRVVLGVIHERGLCDV